MSSGRPDKRFLRPRRGNKAATASKDREPADRAPTAFLAKPFAQWIRDFSPVRAGFLTFRPFFKPAETTDFIFEFTIWHTRPAHVGKTGGKNIREEPGTHLVNVAFVTSTCDEDHRFRMATPINYTYFIPVL